jgi:hypothetical protein
MVRMRNDARPIGEDSPASPVGGDDAAPHADHPEDDARQSVSRDRQSTIVNQGDTNKPGLDDEGQRPAPGAHHPQ